MEKLLGTFGCRFCAKKLTDSSSLYEHEIQIHPGCLINCGFCSLKFPHYLQMTRHVVQDHQPVEILTCLLCGQTYITRRSLKRHLNTHTGDSEFRCAPCGKTFIRRDTLQEHRRSARCGGARELTELPVTGSGSECTRAPEEPGDNDAEGAVNGGGKAEEVTDATESVGHDAKSLDDDEDAESLDDDDCTDEGLLAEIESVSRDVEKLKERITHTGGLTMVSKMNPMIGPKLTDGPNLEVLMVEDGDNGLNHDVTLEEGVGKEHPNESGEGTSRGQGPLLEDDDRGGEECAKERTLNDQVQHVDLLQGSMHELGLVFSGKTRTDGNCWFDAVSDQITIHGIPDKAKGHEQLRAAVCDLVPSLPLAASWVAGAFGGDNKKFEQLLKECRVVGTWTDDFGYLCQATALYIGRDIRIVGTSNRGQKDPYTVLSGGEGAEGLPPLYIGYYQGKHYQSLKLMGEDISDKATKSHSDDHQEPEDSGIMAGCGERDGTEESGCEGGRTAFWEAKAKHYEEELEKKSKMVKELEKLVETERNRADQEKAERERFEKKIIEIKRSEGERIEEREPERTEGPRCICQKTPSRNQPPVSRRRVTITDSLAPAAKRPRSRKTDQSGPIAKGLRATPSSGADALVGGSKDGTDSVDKTPKGIRSEKAEGVAAGGGEPDDEVVVDDLQAGGVDVKVEMDHGDDVQPHYTNSFNRARKCLMDNVKIVWLAGNVLGN